MDGEPGGGALSEQVVAACDAWHHDSRWRADWHAYHLIGDALRSEELALSATRDGAFMRSLRARLASEPVVLAPMAEPVPAALPAAAAPLVASAGGGGRTHWLVAPVAVAAGFVAVASVLVVMGGRGAGPSAEQTLAKAPAPAASWVQQAPAATLAAEVQPLPASQLLLREAGLDGYLSAHRRVSNLVSVAPPGAVVRHVDALAVGEK